MLGNWTLQASVTGTCVGQWQLIAYPNSAFYVSWDEVASAPESGERWLIIHIYSVSQVRGYKYRLSYDHRLRDGDHKIISLSFNGDGR